MYVCMEISLSPKLHYFHKQYIFLVNCRLTQSFFFVSEPSLGTPSDLSSWASLFGRPRRVGDTRAIYATPPQLCTTLRCGAATGGLCAPPGSLASPITRVVWIGIRCWENSRKAPRRKRQRLPPLLPRLQKIRRWRRLRHLQLGPREGTSASSISSRGSRGGRTLQMRDRLCVPRLRRQRESLRRRHRHRLRRREKRVEP
jgi:hypothetical protein